MSAKRERFERAAHAGGQDGRAPTTINRPLPQAVLTSLKKWWAALKHHPPSTFQLLEEK